MTNLMQLSLPLSNPLKILYFLFSITLDIVVPPPNPLKILYFLFNMTLDIFVGPVWVQLDLFL